MNQTKPEVLFSRWVEAPIKALRQLDNGDGGFAALAISLGLYERFIDSVLHQKSKAATSENFRSEASEDLGVSEDVVDRFWNSYRLGLMHAFHPKNYTEKRGTGDSWGWDISEVDGYEGHPKIEERSDRFFVITLDPWKFTEHVIQRWKACPDLLNQLPEFSLGHIARKGTQPESAQLFGLHSNQSGENFHTHSVVIEKHPDVP
jgi:hypothetical protein